MIYILIIGLVLNFYLILAIYFLGIKHGRIISNKGVPLLPLPKVEKVKDYFNEKKSTTIPQNLMKELDNFDIDSIDEYYKIKGYSKGG